MTEESERLDRRFRESHLVCALESNLKQITKAMLYPENNEELAEKLKRLTNLELDEVLELERDRNEGNCRKGSNETIDTAIQNH